MGGAVCADNIEGEAENNELSSKLTLRPEDRSIGLIFVF